MNTGAEDVGVVQAEARGQQGSVEEQQDEFLDCLVACVSLSTVPQLLAAGESISAQLGAAASRCASSYYSFGTHEQSQIPTSVLKDSIGTVENQRRWQQ